MGKAQKSILFINFSRIKPRQWLWAVWQCGSVAMWQCVGIADIRTT